MKPRECGEHVADAVKWCQSHPAGASAQQRNILMSHNDANAEKRKKWDVSVFTVNSLSRTHLCISIAVRTLIDILWPSSLL